MSIGVRPSPPTPAEDDRDTRVPFTRLDNCDPRLLAELLEVVARIARSAAFTLGEEVERFEREFASWCETDHAVGVSSGTAALELALRGLGIGSGDEVILPTNSFVATAEAVSAAGATPRLVDVDPGTALLTAQSAERALTPRTRCVIPVHLYGRTVEMAPLLSLCRARGVRVVEDACQAHGARYRGRPVGSLGDAGCFSFYPTKNLGAWGDGGAVVTGDAELAARVRLLRSHGEATRHHHELPARTDRLDALQAAILRVKLACLDDANERRRAAGAALREALADSPVAPLPRPPPTAITSSTSSSCVLTSETRCGITSAPTASRARSITRRRSTASLPTRTWDWSPAAFRSRSGWPRRAARCRSSRRSSRSRSS